MNGLEYIKKRQTLWALRNELEQQSSEGTSGTGYTKELSGNLFLEMSKDTEDEFMKADGGELKQNPCKMQALHSSSALGVNIFEYWRDKDKTVLAKSLEIPVSGLDSLCFEQQMDHAESVKNKKTFPKSPNMDVLVRYKRSNTHVIGIECKFSEAYGRAHSGIRPAYLAHPSLWGGIPSIKKWAQKLSPEDQDFVCLHPAQLIKHILALKHECAKYKHPTKKFWLVYLWYDVPTAEGAQHRTEIKEFGEVVSKDGIRFHPISYQKLIRNMFHYGARTDHQAYLDYIAERYL